MPIDLPNLPEKISKPVAEVANSLINKISSAVGQIYEPIHIRRIARANADAKQIAVLGELRTEIEARAMRRLLAEETRKQENIEAIVDKAIENLEVEDKPEAIDDDWMALFFEKAKLVSDEQVQSVWAKILAGEAKKKGAFNKRTLEFLATLEKKEADMFTSLCRFVALGNPIIFDYNDEIYKNYDINFQTLSHMDTIGLITFEALTGYGISKFSLPAKFDYGETVFILSGKNGENEFGRLKLGKVEFTETGRQLFPLSNADIVPGFAEYLVSQFERQGLSVTLQ